MWFILQHWCEWKESKKGQRNTFTFVILHSWFQALFERSLLSLSLCIHNTQHRMSGSAHWCSKGHRIASALELLGSPKKAQAQVKIVLLYSRGVKETFPEVSSKPCPWACWQWPPPAALPRAEPLEGSSAGSPHGRFAVNVCPPSGLQFSAILGIGGRFLSYQHKSPISYSPEGWHAASYLLAERWNIWSWLWGYITPLKLWSV